MYILNMQHVSPYRYYYSLIPNEYIPPKRFTSIK
jgi:hypothetical protein